MAGKLSFQLEMLGSDKIIAQLNEILSIRSKLEGTGSGTVGTGKSISRGMDDAEKATLRFNKALEKTLALSSKMYKPAFLGFGSGITPNIHIAGTGTRALSGANPFQAGANTGGGLATGLPSMVDPVKSREAMLRRDRYERMVEADRKKEASDSARFFKDMTFMMGPMFNPGSVWTTMFASRQIFSAMMTDKGQGIVGKMGMSGIGGAGVVAGGLVAGLTAIGFALKGFQAAIQGAKSAIQSAFGIYTGAAQQGLSTQFFARRQALSGMLGVQGNPNNVFYFGKAIQEISPKIEQAVKTISGNAPILADTSMRAKILKLDFEALFSELAVNAKPAIDLFIKSIDSMVKFLTDKAWDLYYAWNVVKTGNPLTAAALTMSAIASSVTAKSNLLTSPLSIMAKQLPASQWEHMGLVIGGGFQQKSMEYQRQTAQGVNRLVGLVQGNTKKATNDYYLGYNPFVAGP